MRKEKENKLCEIIVRSEINLNQKWIDNSLGEKMYVCNLYKKPLPLDCKSECEKKKCKLCIPYFPDNHTEDIDSL